MGTTTADLRSVPVAVCCKREIEIFLGVGTLQAPLLMMGERYELHLCEDCFFHALAYLKQERRTQHLFSEDGENLTDNLGLVEKDDYFGGAGSR